MSKVVDERVVSMQFDNKQFESGVSSTLSLLDKLKLGLNFNGASKGLHDIGSAAKGIDLSHVAAAAETVRVKFSALNVMGVTALTNITNSAIDAGKKIANALMIEPMTTGFSEYELKMDSVKNIVNGVVNEYGSYSDALKAVNGYLEELNTYSDQTIYSFSDMTESIGKFTNSGVKLEDAVLAIKGISNEAAVSGANANEASRAMYNFAQALSAGSVKLIDWKSIENANMATVEFKQQLIDTAVEVGTLTKAADGMYKAGKQSMNATENFNDSLKEEWMTTEVLIGTLRKYADANTDIGKKAFAAAQEVTKFSQMWDVLKETAQSGWATTWEIIIGDLEEAKTIFTPLTTFFSGIIDSISDARNNLLKGALGSPFGDLADKIGDITLKVEKSVNTVKDYSDIVKKVMSGDFGEGEIRNKKLTEAGYDAAHVQNLVNEALGSATRHATEYKEAQEAVVETQKKSIDELVKMSDAELKAAGVTDAQVKAIREVESEAAKAGISVKQLVENIESGKSGRQLLVESFGNIGQAIVRVGGIIHDAYRSIFKPFDPQILYNLIAGFNKMTQILVVDEKNASNLGDTIKGLFSTFQIATTIIAGPFKIAAETAKQVLHAFGLNILDVTGYIGRLVTGFQQWFKAQDFVGKAVRYVIPYMTQLVVSARGMIDAFMKLPAVENGIDKFISTLKGIKDAVKSLFDSELTFDNVMNALRNIGNQARSGLGSDLIAGFKDVGGFIIDGLVNGITNRAPEVFSAVVNVARGLLAAFRNFMGIASPAKETIKDGEYIGEGWAIGIKNAAKKVIEAASGVAESILDVFSNMNPGSAFAGGVSVGLLVIMKKLVDAFASFAAPAEGVGSLLEGLGDVFSSTSKVIKKSAKSISQTIGSFGKLIKSFSKVFSAKAFGTKANGLFKIAEAIAVIVGAVAVLTLVDPDKLKGAVETVVVLAVVLGALALATDKMAKASVSLEKNGVKLSGLRTTMITIGVAMLLMAAVVKIVGTMEPLQAIGGFVALAAMMGAMVGVFFALGKFVNSEAAKDLDKVGIMMKKMAVSMLLMVAVVKLAGTINKDEALKATIGVTGFVAFVALLGVATRTAGSEVDKIGGFMLKMSFAMTLMVGVIKLIGSLEWSEMGKGAVGMLGFAAFVKIMIEVVKSAENDLPKIGGLLMALSASMLIMAGTVKLLGSMDLGSIVKGGACVAAFGVIIVELVKSLKAVGPDAPKIALTIMAMSFAIGVMAATSILLGLIPIQNLAKGIAAVSALSFMMSIMIKATKEVSGCKDELIVLTVAIGVIAAAVAGLSMIDGKKLAGATVALGSLMGMFAVMAKVAGTTTASIGSLIALTAVVAALAGIVALLSKLDTGKALGSTAAISILLLSMAGALAIMSGIGPLAIQGAIALGMMSVVVTVLAGMLGMLSKLDVEPSKEIIASIIILMGSMTVVMAVLAVVGPMAGPGLAALGLMALIVGGIIGMLALLKVLKIEPAVETINGISKMLLAMSASCAILTVVGLAGPAAEVGITALIALMGAILGAILVLGIIVKYSPLMEEFINRGAPLLEKLAYYVGKIIGNITGGFMDGAAKGLPKVAENLSEFMVNLDPFIRGAQGIDATAMSNIGHLASAILILSAAELVSGIASIITLGGNFATLGKNLADFMTNALPFIEGARLIDPGVVESTKMLADVIYTLTKADLISGIASFIPGASSLADFGSTLADLGTNISTFAANLGTFDDSKLEAVKFASKAIKAIASAASEIPNDGGLWGMIVGENSIADFAGKLPDLGSKLGEFADNLGTFDDTKVAAVKSAGEAIKAIATAASKIPNDGGLWASIAGDNGLAQFAGNLPDVGKHLGNFASNLGTFDNDKVQTVKCASSAIKSLAEAAKNIPNEGGLWSAIVGDNSLASFGAGLSSLGANIHAFAANLGSFDNTKVKSVESAVIAIQAFATLNNSNLKGAKNNLEGFSEGLPKLGSNISAFCSNMSGAGDISGAIANLDLIKSAIKDISDKHVKSAKNFSESLGTLGKAGVDAFVSAFTSNAAKTDVRTSASELADKAVEGVKSKKDAAKTAGSELAATAASGAKNSGARTDFYTNGQYIGEGLVLGISSKHDSVYKAAFALGRTAVRGEKDGQASHSPSKLTIQAGKWLGEGLIIGMNRMTNSVYSAGRDIGETATGTITSAVTRIAQMIDSDIDAQPTIRPVLDLSSVESGIGTIGSMLNGSYGITAAANVGTIGSMMNRRNQNSTNDDVVYAINSLRKELGNVGGTTYSINGVTYDDGSNVSDAIRTIVRAARVERRV